MAVTLTIVCGCWMVNTVERGVTLTPSIWVFILREGFHKHSHAASRPLGLWFVNELLYWLASLLASLEDTNNTPHPFFSYPQKTPDVFLFHSDFMHRKKNVGKSRRGGGREGGHYRKLLYVWLKSLGLSSVSPLQHRHHFCGPYSLV